MKQNELPECKRTSLKVKLDKAVKVDTMPQEKMDVYPKLLLVLNYVCFSCIYLKESIHCYAIKPAEAAVYSHLFCKTGNIQQVADMHLYKYGQK